MERDSKSIQEIMKKIIFLLETNDEKEWANHLKYFMFEFSDPKRKIEVVKNILNIYRGGMSSFTDLVLQKECKMLIKENDQLADLKHELYNSCLEFCARHQIKVG